ncbi:unnamed protein product [Darwinula stevensoni]|uniref:Uncharacterized protein n=1 Tax=Darwinula stevensoni TaxID=69355 RepID=A0A7R8XD40_9CRUS|nr:unnamed protein product [Darwinula stevensoni]CAG0889431.1 unnamed protein product [Darwinula stevensoni]
MLEALGVLTPKQKALVDEETWLLLVAGGSGTGKTVVVVERAKRLAKSFPTDDVLVVNLPGGHLTEVLKECFREMPSGDNIKVLDGKEQRIPVDRKWLFDFLKEQGEGKHVLLDEVPLTLGIHEEMDEKSLCQYWEEISSLKKCVKSLTFSFRSIVTTYTKDINLYHIKFADARMNVLNVVKRNTLHVSELFLALGDYSRRIFVCQEPTIRNMKFIHPEIELLPTLFPIPSCSSLHYPCKSKPICETTRSCKAILTLLKVLGISPEKQLYVVVDSLDRRNCLVNMFTHMSNMSVKFIDQHGRLRQKSEVPAITIVTDQQILGYHQENTITVILDIYGCRWKNYSRMISSCHEHVIIVMEDESLLRGKYSQIKAAMPDSVENQIVPDSTRSIFQEGLNEILNKIWEVEEKEFTNLEEATFSEKKNFLNMKTSVFTLKAHSPIITRTSSLAVVFGPPSSGKSMLLLESIHELAQDHEDKEGILLFHMGSTLSQVTAQHLFRDHACVHVVRSKPFPPKKILEHDRVEEAKWKYATLHIFIDDYPVQAKCTEEEIQSWKEVLNQLKKDPQVTVTIAFQCHSSSGREISQTDLSSYFEKEKVTVIELRSGVRHTSKWLLTMIYKNETNAPMRLETKCLPTGSRPGALVYGPKPKLIVMNYDCTGSHISYKCKGQKYCMPFIGAFLCFRFAMSLEMSGDPVHVLVSDRKLISFLQAISNIRGRNLKFFHPEDFRGCESSVCITINVDDTWLLESISRARTDLFVIDCLPEHQQVWHAMQEEDHLEIQNVKEIGDMGLPWDEDILLNLNSSGNFLEDYGPQLQRLWDIFKDSSMLVDMQQFLDKLEEKNLISRAQKVELKEKKHAQRIDDTFSILQGENGMRVNEKILVILKEMHMEDIIQKMLHKRA